MDDENQLPGDALDWTPGMALAHAQRACAEQDWDACVIVFLDRTEGQYTTHFINAGLTASEMVALLEVQKQRLISRHINGEEEAGV